MASSSASTNLERLRLRSRDAGAVAVLAALAAVLYLPRLLPGTGYSPDTMKYHYIGAVLGISHPPGSPLYLLVNWVVAQIPVGELAWRLNAFSALMAAVSGSILYLLARDVAGSRLAALAAGIVLLTAGMFWEQSVIAEVYTFHAALLLGSAWCLVRWRRTSSPRDLGAAAGLYGLSFGVHLMSWYALPGWIAMVLVGRESILRRPRELRLVSAGALLGMSTYLYYAIRPAMNPVYVEFRIDSVSTFFDYITGSYFRKYMFAFDTVTMFSDRLPWLARTISANVGMPLLAIGAIGITAIARRDPRLAVFVTAPILLSGLYAMGYSVPDAHVYALPALYFLLVAIAVGLTAISQSLTRWTGRRWVAVVGLAMVAGVIAHDRAMPFARNRVVLDRSHDTRFADVAGQIIGSVDRRATIVTGSDWNFHALAYYLWGRRARPRAEIEVKSHSPERCEETRASIDRYMERGPVYVTTELTDCITHDTYELDVRDLSRTLPGYLSAISPGRLALLAIQDEGAAGIDAPAWDRLRELHILTDMRGHDGWSYAAVVVRTRSGFSGIERSGATGAWVDIKRGDTIADGLVAPFDVSVRSGGQLSGRQASLVAAGDDYARPLRGLQIVLFDSASGAPLERVAFDTHRSISLGEFHFVRILARKPARGAQAGP